MLVDSVAGACLLAGASRVQLPPCAAAARAPARGPRGRARDGRRRRAGGREWAPIAGVCPRRPPPSRCSCWRSSDASTGCRGSTRSWAAPRTAALAVAPGADAAAVVGGAGVAGGARALPRRRAARCCSPSPACGAGRRPVARPGRGGRAWASPRGCPSRRRGRARSSARSCSRRSSPSPRSRCACSPSASSPTSTPVAIALAAATVLAGMARAGLTVIQRLRETRTQALTDDLTGLGNRRHLVDTLHATIASAKDRRRARAAADRPRRLQGAQRHARPPRRRRGAAPDRPAPHRTCCAATTRSRASAATSSR